MYAVIKTGGKQYRVAPDEEITIEKLAAGAGDRVQFNDVLMIGGEDGVTLGQPTVDDAAVQAEVLDHTRGEKVYTFKKRRRKHGSKTIRGHRQDLTVVKIVNIMASGGAASGVSEAKGAASGAAQADGAE